MKTAALLFVLLVLGFLQVGFFPSLWTLAVAPNLLLVGMVAWFVLGHRDVGVFWAAGSGLFLDLFSPSLFGLFTICFLGTALLIRVLRDAVFSSVSRWPHVVLTAVGSLICLLVPLGARWVHASFSDSALSVDVTGTLFFALLGSFLLSCFASVLLQPFFVRLASFFLFVEKRRARRPFG